MRRLAANPSLLHQRTPPQLKMQMTGASAPSCSPRCPQLKPLFSSAPQTLFPNIILSVSFETRSRCFSRISAAKQRQQEAVKSDKKRTGRRRAPVKPPPDGDDAAIEAEAELQAPTVGRRSSSHPSPLPKPPAGFVLDARGKVLSVSNKRIATIVDATNNLPLECVIRRVFQSSRGDECMLLCPVDTPVQILKSTNFRGWSAVNDDEVEDILPSAAYALAKIHMHLVVSGFCYTARGGFCYSEDDIIEFCTDDGHEIDGLPTEGLEISCFNLDGVHYMIYTPSDPLLFVASKDENGMLQIADDDLLEDPAIVDAIDEETEFNALVGIRIEKLGSKLIKQAAAMSLNGGIRSGFKALVSSKAALSKSVSRGIHATGVKRMGGHGHDEPYYVHAKHMYNLDRMKHQKLKMSLGVLAAFSIGVGVPVYAVIFQQKKTSSA